MATCGYHMLQHRLTSFLLAPVRHHVFLLVGVSLLLLQPAECRCGMILTSDETCRIHWIVWIQWPSHTKSQCTNSSRCLPEHSAIQTAGSLFWPGPSQHLNFCRFEFWSVLHSAGLSEITNQRLNHNVLLTVWTVRGHKLPAWLDWFWRTPAHPMKHFTHVADVSGHKRLKPRSESFICATPCQPFSDSERSSFLTQSRTAILYTHHFCT